MSTRALRVAITVGVTAVSAVVAGLADPGGPAPGLIILGGGIVVGELLPLRPPVRGSVPLSFAVFVVLAGQTGLARYAVIVIVAELAASMLVEGAFISRVLRLAARLATATAVIGAVMAIDALVPDDTEVVQLVAALGGAVAALVVGDLLHAVGSRVRVRRGLQRRLPISLTGRSADLIIVSTAVLMTASVEGRDEPGFGLWGLAFCSIPLLMAWYATERLAAARTTYDQSIQTLSVLPEIVGWVPHGRATRVAQLSVEVGEELGLERWELDRLATAALLHELGRVCLDDPSGSAPDAIAGAGVQILSATDELSGAAAILEAELDPETAPVPYATAGAILTVVGAFEDASHGRWPESQAAAEEGLASLRPSYDVRTVRILETVLDSARTRP